MKLSIENSAGPELQAPMKSNLKEAPSQVILTQILATSGLRESVPGPDALHLQLSSGVFGSLLWSSATPSLNGLSESFHFIGHFSCRMEKMFVEEQGGTPATILTATAVSAALPQRFP